MSAHGTQTAKLGVVVWATFPEMPFIPGRFLHPRANCQLVAFWPLVNRRNMVWNVGHSDRTAWALNGRHS